MALPGFIREDAVLIIEDARDNRYNGAWKINKVSGTAAEAPVLSLESVYRKNKAYLNIPYSASIMREMKDSDVAYDDAFLPLGSQIRVEGEADGLRNGDWVVDGIRSGDSLENARLTLKKIAPAFNSGAAYMTTAFDPRTMSVVKKAKPQMGRLILKP